MVVCFTEISFASLGLAHSMVLTKDGSMWATGKNDFGQLGDGSTTNGNEFVEVTSDVEAWTEEDVIAIAAGAYHSMVLKEDGTVWDTGLNDFGQIADGYTDEGVDEVDLVVRLVKIITHLITLRKEHKDLVSKRKAAEDAYYNFVTTECDMEKDVVKNKIAKTRLETHKNARFADYSQGSPSAVVKRV